MKKIICVLFIGLTLNLVVGLPKNAASRTPSNFKRFFEVLGMRSDTERQLQGGPNPSPSNGAGSYPPCYPGQPLQPPTTTPIPLRPMCPLYPPPQPNVRPPQPPVAPLLPPVAPLIGGNANPGAQGGNIYPPERPAVPLAPNHYFHRPEIPVIGIGGNTNGVATGGGNVQGVFPNRFHGNLYPNPFPFPGFPTAPGTGIGGGANSVATAGEGNQIGGNAYPYERPGGFIASPYFPKPEMVPTVGLGGNANSVATGGPGNGQGDVYTPEQPGGILVSQGIYRPEIGPVPVGLGDVNAIPNGGLGNAIGENNFQHERPGGFVNYHPKPEVGPPTIGIGGNSGPGSSHGGNFYQPERPEGFLVGPYPRPEIPPRPEQPRPEVLRPEVPRPVGFGGDTNAIPGGGPGPAIGNIPRPPEPFIGAPSEPRPVPVPSPFGQNFFNGGQFGQYSSDSPFPFVPQGFSFVSPHLIPQSPQCPLSPRPDQPLCSTMEMLDKLQLHRMFGYIQKAGLEQLFQMTHNYTFFIPADPAFATIPEWFLSSLESDVKLLRAFVLNHFIKVDAPLQDLGNEFLILNARPGGNRLRTNVYFPNLPYRVHTIDGAAVLLGDIVTRTGRLNIVNRVLLPHPPRNAVQYLQEIPEFSNFMSAVVAANMLEVLQGPEPITFFIPYNDAFTSFDFQSLLQNATALRNFVNYHIVRGTYYSNGLLNGQYLTTFFDKEIRLSVVSDGFSKTLTAVNNVNRVLKPDIPILNGVAHVISGVMSRVEEFYYYQQMNEFNTLNFGSLKRNMVVDNQIKEESTK